MPRSKIFLSYRRDDSSGYTELLFTRLTAHYGRAAVFRDVHSIHPAERFREAIGEALAECAVCVVVIGKGWAGAIGPDGVKRLEKPDDVLRNELLATLDRGAPVLPVLVGGADMPTLADLPEALYPIAEFHALRFADEHADADFERLVEAVDRVTGVAIGEPLAINPFNARNPLRSDDTFHDRRDEIRMLRDFVKGRQNCQIVGPKRIGKSSLLLYVQRHVAQWTASARIVYIDLHDPRCFTLKGWLKEVGDGLGLPRAPESLVELMDGVEDMLAGGLHPVVCLDEFGEMTRREAEFPRDVFLTLRSCGQRGMSILTASTKPLSALTKAGDDTSPFFNTFPFMPLGPFSQTAAAAFVATPRGGAPAFTASEQDRILEFAQGAPLALQAACFYVLEARQSGEALPAALARARNDCAV